MKFDTITFIDKEGNSITLRNAQLADADDLIIYLDKTAGETPYTLREPGEVRYTLEQEEEFIQQKNDSPKELMLLAFDGKKHVGNCTLTESGTTLKTSHRCSVAIALYKEYWGRGIGSVMLKHVLDVAKRVGYEQAELEVIAGNEAALGLYESLGFVKYGEVPNCLKFKDGSYADAYWMMKKLK